MLRRTCANTNHRHSICNMFSFQLLKNIQKMWCWKQGNMLSNKTCDPSAILRNVLLAHVQCVQPLKLITWTQLATSRKRFPNVVEVWPSTMEYNFLQKIANTCLAVTCCV
jgi:hypothetical protein